MNFTYSIISMAILLVLPLLLAKVFEKIDKDMSIQLRKKDTVIMVIAAVIVGVLLGIMYQNALMVVNVSIVCAYLIFMSYTDIKTGLIYSSVSIIMFFIELLFLVLVYNDIKDYINIMTWMTFIIPAALFVISIFRGIGLGDVYIYIVLSIHYIQTRTTPSISILLNLLFAEVMFVVVTIIYKLVTKDKTKNLPFTIYIAISSIVCSILTI